MESLSEASCELKVDVIHAYVTQPNVVNESRVGSEELDSQYAFVDHASSSRAIPDLDTLATFNIGSPSHVTKDNSFRINNLEASTSLSLKNPDLIDWSAQHQAHELLSFHNDYEITCYLNAIEPITSSTSELVVHMTKLDIKYLSHKIKRKNKWSGGENLFEAPMDEVLGSLPSYF